MVTLKHKNSRRLPPPPPIIVILSSAFWASQGRARGAELRSWYIQAPEFLERGTGSNQALWCSWLGSGPRFPTRFVSFGLSVWFGDWGRLTMVPLEEVFSGSVPGSVDPRDVGDCGLGDGVFLGAHLALS